MYKEIVSYNLKKLGWFILLGYMIGFQYERAHWERGLMVAGADEVGRGALAGPVVAATVVFAPFNFKIPDRVSLVRDDSVRIDDSKQLTRLEREVADKWIRGNCLTFGIGEGSVAEINKFGIVLATNMAYRRAIAQMSHQTSHLLVDAFYIPYLRGIPRTRQTAIVKGDSVSFSIAAASIIAKVYRDELMHRLACEHEQYYWGSNVGYGTKAHRDAIALYGLTPHHRSLFVRKFI